MSIKSYRKIWENFHGEIPKDEFGRTYEIHHLDGNKSNNDISNLICVSIKEHYDIHYKQNDWGACQAIIIRMNVNSDEISKLASLSSKQRVENKTHNFLSGKIASETQRKRVKEGTHHFLDGEISSRAQRKKVEEGTHHFLGGEIQSRNNIKRVKEGTHHLCGSNHNLKRLERGTHPAQITHICPHCNKSGKGGAMKRFHFDNCKIKGNN